MGHGTEISNTYMYIYKYLNAIYKDSNAIYKYLNAIYKDLNAMCGQLLSAIGTTRLVLRCVKFV